MTSQEEIYLTSQLFVNTNNIVLDTILHQIILNNVATIQEGSILIIPDVFVVVRTKPRCR